MRLFLSVFAACLALWSGGAAARALDLGQYHALVIGSNDYRHLPKLVTAVEDARSVHELLSRDYGFNSRLLLNPDRYSLLRAFDTLRAELTERDNLLIYYAGHGVLDRETDQGFWLPVDAEEESQANWVPIFHISSMLRAIAAKHVLIVADSCYSGTLTRDAPALRIVGDADRRHELARLAEKRSRKALVSGGLEPVLDGGGGGHSVFARAFLDALRENGEVLDGYELFRRIRQPVMVNAAQTPKYADIRMAGDEGGDFLFAPRRALAAVAPSSPPPAVQPVATESLERQAELAHWEEIKDSNSIPVLQTYLVRYPNGFFADVVRARMQKLEAAASAPAARTPPQPAAAPTRTAMVAPSRAPSSALDGRWRGGNPSCSNLTRGARAEVDLDVTVAQGRAKAALALALGHWLQTSREEQTMEVQADNVATYQSTLADVTVRIAFDEGGTAATATVGSCRVALRRVGP